MGMSDPEVRKKFSEPRWLQYKHESEKQKLAAVEETNPSIPTLPDLQAREGERAIKYRLATASSLCLP
jgi:hypothetical protein